MLDNTAVKKYKKWAEQYQGYQDVWESIEIFHNNRNKFTYKSIYSYTLGTLLHEIKEKNIKSKRQLKYAGSKLISEGQEVTAYKIIRIDTFEAAKKYFSETKLCVTNRKDFFDYIFDNYVLYAIIVTGDRGVQKYGIIARETRKKNITINIYDELDALYDNDEFGSNIIDLIQLDTKVLKTNLYMKLTEAADDNLIETFLEEYSSVENPCHSITLKKIIEANDSYFFAQDTNAAASFLTKKLKHRINKAILLKHIQSPLAQTLLATYGGVKYISKINYRDPSIKKILLKRAKESQSIKKKCMSLGLLSEPKPAKKISKRDLQRENESLRQRIQALENAVMMTFSS